MDWKDRGIMHLALPFEIPFDPMEAKRVEKIPEGTKWQFEPKWDGFRALTFKDSKTLFLQSKSGQDLGRYFPEIVNALESLRQKKFVFDGELILIKKAEVSFDDLQLRLHPAASRIQKLSKETPATYMIFDLLYDGKKALLDRPLRERRKMLGSFYKKAVPKKLSSLLKLSPYSCKFNKAKEWFEDGLHLGLDGVMAKDANEPYHSGDREGMVKVKHLKEADCVVAGFRVQTSGDSIAALTLGLYDSDGLLHHIGSASAFSMAERKKIFQKLKPFSGRGGFTGRSPGQSRWSKAENKWTPIEIKFVVEVRYDYFSQGRFRHGVKVLRWREDKLPKSCTFQQLE